MASSRKPRSASVTVALSGGVDSVVLLHVLSRQFPVRAIHVHHGLSPHADAWARFCRQLCRRWKIPLTIKRVKVTKRGKGPEAAAREARYAMFRKIPGKTLALAHHLDDHAETVLMNLLRGAGARGASGMAAVSRFEGKRLLRPLLEVSRKSILDYARAQRLEWIEDESNADESLTRNFIRRRVGPLLEARFPRWKEALGRAARHISRRDADAEGLLRKFLREKGLKSPSEAKLVEMLKQLTAGGARTLIEHDGARVRKYRGTVLIDSSDSKIFAPIEWKGERKLSLPGGTLHFRRARGKGIDLKSGPLFVRLRSGGERLQPDPRRPRRTLKNLFQEAGVPPWERERLPLVYCGEALAWAPGLGIDARYQASGKARGVVPEWRSNSLFLRRHDKISG